MPYQASLDDVKFFLKYQKAPRSFDGLDAVARRRQIRTLRKYAKGFHFDRKADTLYYVKHEKAENCPPNYARVLFTRDEVEAVLADIHGCGTTGTHMGMKRTQANIASRFYWRSMTADIKQWITTCPECQKVARVKTIELEPIYAEEPWQSVGVDFVGPLPQTARGFEYVITLTCLFSKWVEAEPVAEKSAEAIFETFTRVCYRLGFPSRVVTDQGEEFNNELLDREFFGKFGVQHSAIVSYHPQSSERTNGALKRHLSKIVDQHRENWDRFLSQACWEIRSSPDESTKRTPYEVMFLRKPRSVGELEDDGDSQVVAETSSDELAAAVDTYVAAKQASATTLHEQVNSNLATAKRKDKRCYALKQQHGTKLFEFRVGMEVMKMNTKKQNQLEPDWLPGYRITTIEGRQAKLINTRTAQVLQPVRLSQLKPFLAGPTLTAVDPGAELPATDADLPLCQLTGT